jgi:hypothetical protein
MKYFNKLIISVITFGFCFLFLGMLSDNELYAGTGEVTWVDYKIFVNETEITSDVGFYESDGIILAPIRSIAESMNLGATWNSVTRQITFTSNDDVFACTIESDKYTFNGIENDMPLPPVVFNDRTLIPAKVVVEAFGGTFRFEERVDTTLKYTVMSVPFVRDNSADVQLGTMLIDIPNVAVISDTNGWLINLPNGIDLTNGFKDKTKVSVAQTVYEAQQVADIDLLVSNIYVIIPEHVGGELNGLMGNAHDPNCSIKTAKIAKDGRALEIVFNGKKRLGAENNRGQILINFEAVKIGEYSGNINGLIISQVGSPFPDAFLTLGVVVKHSIEAIISSIKIISEIADQVDDIFLRSFFEAGEEIYLTLPNGFIWNVGTASVSSGNIPDFYIKNVDNNGQTLTIKAPDSFLEPLSRIINIENLRVTAIEDVASEGDIIITIHSDKGNMPSKELVIANYVKDIGSKQVLIIDTPLQNTIITPLKPTLELIFAQGINPRDHALNIVASSGKPKVKLPKTGESFITPQMTISSGGGVQVEIPAGTTITGPSGWDGTINLPIVVNTPSQNLGSNQFVIKAGLESGSLDFSEPVWLFAPGQGSKAVKVIRNGTVNDVTHVLPSNSLAAAKEALVGGRTDAKFIDGDDLFIWTTRFSEFVAYSPSSSSPGAGGGGGGGITTPKGERINVNGGQISNWDVIIDIPAKAVAKDIYILIEEVSSPPSPTLNNEKLVSDVYSITKNVEGNFAKPVKVSIPFKKEKVSEKGYHVNLCWYDEQAKDWKELESTEVDWERGIVAGETNHFSKFAVIARSIEPENVEEEQLTSFVDIRDHWAVKPINDLLNQGITSGYPDGTFRPDVEITRAEFTCLIVKAFEMEAESDINFTDTEQHWAKQAISTARAHGVVSGYNDNYFGPEDPVTREQMAVIMMKAINCQPNSLTVDFEDRNFISDWATEAVANAVNRGILSGYPDNTFRPDKALTRAEAVVVINTSLKLQEDTDAHNSNDSDSRTYDKKGYYGPTSGTENIAGSVNIKADGVVLRNLIIDGDLIIAEEVGQGTVTLNNVVVKGNTFVRGGGPNSIHINGGQYNQIIIENIEDKVRIVAIDVNGSNIIISENAQGEEIILEGDFDTVNVNAPGVRITTNENTTIQELTIEENAKESIINLSSDTVIRKMIIEAKTEVRGTGIVNTAQVNADGVVFQTKPDQTIVSSGVDKPIIAPQTPSSGGGGGGGGSGGTPPVEQELALSPTSCLFYKNAPNDIHINVIWGKATRITKITGSALTGAVKINLQERIHYTVSDNHDGTGVLTIKHEVTNLLPVPPSALPDGIIMTFTIDFDQGEETVTVTVANDPSIVNVSPSVVLLNKDQVNDMIINIFWGPATRITGITGSGLDGEFNSTLQEGIHYGVIDYGNGRGTLTIKKNLVNLLPVPIEEIPDGTMLTFNVVFDQGEKELGIIVGSNRIPPYVNPTSWGLDKNNVSDIELNVIWNDAAQINSITLSPYSNAAIINLEAGTHYVVNDNGDGTASLTVRSNVFGLLPEPLSELQPGSQMKINIEFDYGVFVFNIQVLGDAEPATGIGPAYVNLNKNDVQDIPLNVSWGNATEITRIRGRVLDTMETFDPELETHYTVHNNGDGTGLLTLKTGLFDLLSVPVSVMPNGTEVGIFIEFDGSGGVEIIITLDDLVLNPASVDLSKTNLADIPINIVWGSVTEITEIKCSALTGAIRFSLQEGTHYTVNDNGDGTGTLTVLSLFTELIPVEITMIPDGVEFILTIVFDQGGERDFIITITR